ncbi:IQ domain-containing protein K [Taenia solium]|eukprot:TsM_000244100 transcript=TsM_000244100 gene=TsM_000244100
MTKINFLPVDVLLKICRSAQEPIPQESPNLPKEYSDDPSTPSRYFKLRILPTLEPILRSMLAQVIAKDVLLKPHSSFNAIDYLSLELYRNNPAKSERIETVKSLEDIDWVAKHRKLYSQTMLPLSWHLTRAEAATIIQKHWRGYLVLTYF